MVSRATFYRPPTGGVGPATLGPFYPTGNNGLLLMGPTSGPGGAGQTACPYLFEMLRGFRFPGLMKTESPARGAVVCPAAAGITDHSTLTLPDSYGSPVAFEFVKDGDPVTPGNIEVDIQGAVTAEDVADELADAVNEYTATLDPTNPDGSGSGWLASIDQTNPARVRLVQARWSRSGPGTTASLKGTWFTKTLGAFGNGAIVASVSGEWDGGAGEGSLTAFAGGKQREAGVLGIVALPGGPWALALASYAPPIAPEEG